LNIFWLLLAKSKFYLILEVGGTPLYFFLACCIVFYRNEKVEDISGNLCPPVHYSHSPMKKNNNNSLVKNNNISTKKPVLSTPTKRTQTLVFFWFHFGLFL
jgi:hypothetical protein